MSLRHKIIAVLLLLSSLFVLAPFYSKNVYAQCAAESSVSPSSCSIGDYACTDNANGTHNECSCNLIGSDPSNPADKAWACKIGCPGSCSGGDGWTCFPAGTKVLMGDKGQKNIEEVKVGDKVVSQDESGKKSVSTVTKLDQPVRNHMCQINFTNGEKLKLTDEHPLFTQDGWKAINPKNTYKDNPNLPVSQLNKGDRVTKSDGTKAEVDYFACWSEQIQTYNLILDQGANTYFAGGFLAHNKEGWACPAGTSLSCGTQQEAVQQSKKGCLSKGACIGVDSDYPPSYLDNVECASNPLKFDCYWNCSCCPSDKKRSCTLGDTYTKTKYWETLPAATKRCDTRDDIVISTVYLGDNTCYEDEYGKTVCAYKVTCQSQTCKCVPKVTPTPTPPLPSCQPWTSIYINDCSQAEYQPPRQPDCLTTTRSVTLNLNSSNASQMGFANVDPGQVCPDIPDTSFSGPQAYATTRNWTLSAGYDQKKVCARFANTTGSRKCGAQIEYVSPTPTPLGGTIAAVAKVVQPGSTACLNIVNSTSGLGGTVFTTTPKLTPANRTQSGTTPVQWTNVPANVTYTLGVTPPAGGYSQANICRTKTGGAPYQAGDTATLLAGETINWYVGFLGPTPTASPVGTIRARAVEIDPADTSCATVRAATTGIPGTVFSFTASSPSQPPPQTQTGAAYVTFASLPTGTYTLVSQPPSSEWVLAQPCWALNPPPTAGQGLSAILGNNQTLSWDLGYTRGTAWVQALGGDVYTSGNLKSYIPAVSPRVFVKDGASGYPGVVTYGSSYDFSSTSAKGSDLVSSTNWLANSSRSSTNYYELFYRRLGAPTTPDYDHPITPLAKPASRTKPYYVLGDLTTSGNWTIGNGETIVFLIDGNLTINGRINIPGSGFITFIVKGNIQVSPSVGVPYTSSTPVLEGIYVTSGTFLTGESSVANAERLVGRGSFIAGSFNLQRDLSAVGANPTTSAEYFIYYPRLLLTMPDYLKDQPIRWQEVAP